MNNEAVLASYGDVDGLNRVGQTVQTYLSSPATGLPEYGEARGQVLQGSSSESFRLPEHRNHVVVGHEMSLDERRSEERAPPFLRDRRRSGEADEARDNGATSATNESQARASVTAMHRLAPRPSSPILLRPLPPTAIIATESLHATSLEFARQSRDLERSKALEDALKETHNKHVEELKKKMKDGLGGWGKLIAGRGAEKQKDGISGAKADEGRGKTKPFERPPDGFELYAAIDRKDINFIMRVRDHAFPLLLQKNAGEFPIVYVARIGKSHQDKSVRDVSRCLISTVNDHCSRTRYVNHLDDEEFGKKETIVTLRQLRTNLKLAIDYALEPSGDTSLLSSYFQVLIMSEGDIWLRKAIHEVALLMRTHEPPAAALRPKCGMQEDSNSTPTSSRLKGPKGSTATPAGRAGGGPVTKAEALIREFATKELRTLGREADVGVEEYIANATMDLVMMAGWSLCVDRISGDLLPTYTFARDQRTYTFFEEALESRQDDVDKKVPKNIRHQLRLVLEICGDTKATTKSRVARLKAEVDG